MAGYSVTIKCNHFPYCPKLKQDGNFMHVLSHSK